jgi:hypothetical protein
LASAAILGGIGLVLAGKEEAVESAGPSPPTP